MTDNLTHSLFVLFIGVILISLLKFKGEKKWPYIAIIIAGNIPDIDIILRIFGLGFYMAHHRVLTHSIIGIVTFTIFLVFMFSYIFEQKQYWKYALLCLVGIIAHIFLDVMTAFGTEFLFPLSSIRFSSNLIPVVDIFVLIIFFIGLWFLKIYKDKRFKVALAVLFIFFIFLFFKWGLYLQASHQVRNLGDNEKRVIVPHFTNPLGWRFIIDEDDYYLVGDFDLTVGGFKNFKKYPLVEIEKINATMDSYLTDLFFSFAKVPYPKVEENKVIWEDLRLTNRIDWISLEFILDDDLNVLSQRFVF